MTTQLTEKQIKDLTMMCNPREWPVHNLLALEKVTRNPDNYLLVDKAEPGTLVYSDQVKRYIFWPGLSFHMPKVEVLTIMAKGNNSGPLLPHQLEDLVREGWEVD